VAEEERDRPILGGRKRERDGEKPTSPRQRCSGRGEGREEGKKLSALTDFGVEREPVEVKGAQRPEGQRGARERSEEGRLGRGVPFFLCPMHLRGS